MSEEQEITITEKGQYKNIRPKDLTEGNFITVEKTFPSGMEVKGKFFDEQKQNFSYSCRVNYKGEEVSFWLNKREHEAYALLGGVGDALKLTKVEEPYTAMGQKRIRETFKFELA